VVSYSEQTVLEVDQIAPHVDRQYLSSTVAGHFVTVGKSSNDHAGLVWSITIPDEDLISVEVSDDVRQVKHRPTFAVI
jgi:hypothetical protein